jgi:hypothetical protein
MRAGRGIGSVLALALVLTVVGPGHVAPVRAAEYTLETTAAYEVRPSEHRVLVRVDLAFTNTTPDPDGQFSVFDELRLAIHDGADAVTASDGDGDLDVTVENEDGVNVATIELREGLRFEETAEVELRYRLADGDAPDVRVGPSLAVFPAWGFGTSSEVSIAVPDGYEVRADGDPLTRADGGLLTSGPIEDPDSWLARVTAIGPPDYAAFEATVPLDGGTADVLVQALGDDPAWGEATRDLLVQALPALERRIGLPYPLLGQLVVTESVPADSTGFGEPVTRRAAIEVGYDQPSFTIVHQLAHLWLDPLVATRWIAEGIASDLASGVASELDLDAPYDPAAEVERLAADRIPLDAWRVGSEPAASAYAYAASWQLVADVRAEIGDDALRTILARTAASVGPYDEASVDVPPSGTATPRAPLTTRSFLDQISAVAGIDASAAFSASALTPDDVELLPARETARQALGDLVAAADGWGSPDPVRAAMTEWAFADAMSRIEAADAWLGDRDALVAEMERVGLSRPDRLPQAFRAYGGGAEAVEELAAERSVVDAYAAASDRIGAPRSFLARLGLVGGADPSTQLGLANGRFADGDLRGALASVEQAVRIMDGAETTGAVRVVSLALIVIALAVIALAVFRRRASYTARR